MDFTYNGYKALIKLLQDHGYTPSRYTGGGINKRRVILRHDVDNSIEKAVKLAELESDLDISSTYFVLVTTNFYNIFSAKNTALLRKIRDLGHIVGLHFDEVIYENATIDELKDAIAREAKLLSYAVGEEVNCVSMHRPSKMMLEADLKIPNMINSYGAKYFKEYKYLSDSRRRWREPAEEIISSEKYDNLHILTHPFWYNNMEKDIHISVKEFINSANKERYAFMKDNITDIVSIMKEEEIANG